MTEKVNIFNPPKRQVHNYTSELELKSLLIRIKNTRVPGEFIKGEKINNRINRAIGIHTTLNNKKYKDSDIQRSRVVLRNKVRDHVVQESEKVLINDSSYERFGEIILLMINRILTKPQFSGYTYRDDFYSDAVYKVVKYLHNFNHNLISERTGLPVNAFAYISQYIHNSVLYIIGKKKKENDSIRELIRIKNIERPESFKGVDLAFNADMVKDTEDNIIDIELTEIVPGDLTIKLKEANELIESDPLIQRVNIIYPETYNINFDEYCSLKEHLMEKISIVRQSVKEEVQNV